MNKQHFLKTIGEIYKKEQISSYDETLFNRFLNNDKKNSVVTIAIRADGSKVFFKAVKPWAEARGYQDFYKGVSLSRLLSKAGSTASVRYITDGEIAGVPYSLSSVLSINETVTDKRLLKLNEVDATRIAGVYRRERKLIDAFIRDNPRQAALFIPYSNFSQQFSFWGQIVLFENNLVKRKSLTRRKFTEIAIERVQTQTKYDNDKLFLLHGDFSPHNIIYGQQIYFIDWERCLVVADELIGENYDLANLYVYSFNNANFQKAIYQNSPSFKICLAYHLLYKANYILTYKIDKDKPLLNWCIEEIDHLTVDN